MQDRNVFVVFNDGHRDFFKAERFGKVQTVMEKGYDSQYRNMSLIVAYIESRIADYREGDYILMVGEPTLCALVMNVVIAHSKSKRIEVLRWDKMIMDYKPVTLDFSVINKCFNSRSNHE